MTHTTSQFELSVPLRYIETTILASAMFGRRCQGMRPMCGVPVGRTMAATTIRPDEENANRAFVACAQSRGARHHDEEHVPPTRGPVPPGLVHFRATRIGKNPDAPRRCAAQCSGVDVRGCARCAECRSGG